MTDRVDGQRPDPSAGASADVRRARRRADRARADLRLAELRYDNAQADIAAVRRCEDEVREAESAHVLAWWESLTPQQRAQIHHHPDGPMDTAIVESLEDAGFLGAGAHWANYAPTPDYHLPGLLREILDKLPDD